MNEPEYIPTIKGLEVVNPRGYCAKFHKEDVLCYGKCAYCGGTKVLEGWDEVDVKVEK